jgi:hypothetical protein
VERWLARGPLTCCCCCWLEGDDGRRWLRPLHHDWCRPAAPPAHRPASSLLHCLRCLSPARPCPPCPPVIARAPRHYGRPGLPRKPKDQGDAHIKIWMPRLFALPHKTTPPTPQIRPPQTALFFFPSVVESWVSISPPGVRVSSRRSGLAFLSGFALFYPRHPSALSAPVIRWICSPPCKYHRWIHWVGVIGHTTNPPSRRSRSHVPDNQTPVAERWINVADPVSSEPVIATGQLLSKTLPASLIRGQRLRLRAVVAPFRPIASPSRSSRTPSTAPA